MLIFGFTASAQTDDKKGTHTSIRRHNQRRAFAIDVQVYT